MLNDNDILAIIDAALSNKADFAEVYLEEESSRGVNLLNGKVIKAGTGRDAGIGIRIMSGTNCVYVYSNDLDREGLIHMARQASSALSGNDLIRCRELSKLCITSPGKIITDPETVSKSDTVQILRQAADFALSYDL